MQRVAKVARFREALAEWMVRQAEAREALNYCHYHEVSRECKEERRRDMKAESASALTQAEHEANIHNTVEYYNRRILAIEVMMIIAGAIAVGFPVFVWLFK